MQNMQVSNTKNTIGISSNDKYRYCCYCCYNWCSKCPPSARTQARRRVHNWFTAAQMILWSKSHHSSISRSIKWSTSHQYARVNCQCWRRQFSTTFYKQESL